MNIEADHPGQTPKASLAKIVLCIILVVLLLNTARYLLSLNVLLGLSYNLYLLILFVTATLLSWFWKRMGITRSRVWLVLTLLIILTLDHVVSNMILHPFYIYDFHESILLKIDYVLPYIEIAVIGIAIIFGYFTNLLAPIWKMFESSGDNSPRPQGKLFDLLRVTLLLAVGLWVCIYYLGIWERDEYDIAHFKIEGTFRVFFVAGAIYLWMWLGLGSSVIRIRIASIIVVCDTLLMSFILTSLLNENYFAYNVLISGILGMLLGIYSFNTLIYRGDAGNRKRLELQRYILEKAFEDLQLRRKSIKSLLIGICLAIVMVIATELLFHFAIQRPAPILFIVVMIIVMPVAGALKPHILELSKTVQPYIGLHPCFKCRNSCEKLEYDEDGWGQCSQCCTQVHAGQWIVPPIFVAAKKKEALKTKTLHQFIMLMGIVGAFPFLALFYYIGILSEVILPISFSMQGWCFLYVARKNRIAKIAVIDNQHNQCRKCLYILRGLQISQGVGRCPECGTQFAKYVKEIDDE